MYVATWAYNRYVVFVSGKYGKDSSRFAITIAVYLE